MKKWQRCGVVTHLLVNGITVLLTLTVYNSTTVSSRSMVSLEHQYESAGTIGARIRQSEVREIVSSDVGSRRRGYSAHSGLVFGSLCDD